MDKEKSRAPISKVLVAGAIAVGVAAGSYGVASAASGSSSGPTSNVLSFAAANAPAASQPSAAQPWGMQRSDETLLTGETASKVTAAAKAKVPNGTIVRVETDADGNAPFEAHMVKADGTPATVYVDKSFSVVSVETR